VNESVDSRPSTARSSPPESAEVSTITLTSSCENFVALRTVPVVLRHGNKSLQVNALLDDGNSRSYVNADVAAELGLVGKSQRIAIRVLNGKHEEFDTMLVAVQLNSIDGSIKKTLNVLTTNKVTGRMKTIDWTKHCHRWNHLKHIPFPKVGHCPLVDLLIGIDYADLHSSKKRGPWSTRSTSRTPNTTRLDMHWNFGRVSHFLRVMRRATLTLLCGSFGKLNPCSVVISKCQLKTKSFLGKRSPVLCYDRGKYQIDIPWKDNIELPDSYSMALKRLNSTEKQLNKNPDVATAHCNNIENYLNKGYTRKSDQVAEALDGTSKYQHWWLVFATFSCDQT